LGLVPPGARSAAPCPHCRSALSNIKTVGSINSRDVTTSDNTTASDSATAGFISAATISLNGMVSSIDSQITQIEKQNAAQLKILEQEYTTAESNAYDASITQTYLSVFLDNSSSSTSS
jgi:hypothetical protein